MQKISVITKISLILLVSLFMRNCFGMGAGPSTSTASNSIQPIMIKWQDSPSVTFPSLKQLSLNFFVHAQSSTVQKFLNNKVLMPDLPQELESELIVNFLQHNRGLFQLLNRPTKTLVLNSQENISSIEWSKDSSRILVKFRNKVELWDKEGNFIAKIKKQKRSRKLDYEKGREDIFFVGKKIIDVYNLSPIIKIYDFNGQLIKTLNLVSSKKWGWYITNMKINNDETKILIVEDDVYFYDLGNDNLVHIPVGFKNRIYTCFHPTKPIVAIVKQESKSINLYTHHGNLLKSFQYSSPIRYIQFNEDGSKIVLCDSYDTHHIYDLEGNYNPFSSNYGSYNYSSGTVKNLIFNNHVIKMKSKKFEFYNLQNDQTISLPLGRGLSFQFINDHILIEDEKEFKIWNSQGELVKHFKFDKEISWLTTNGNLFLVTTYITLPLADFTYEAKLLNINGEILFHFNSLLSPPDFSFNGKKIYTIEKNSHERIIYDLSGNIIQTINSKISNPRSSWSPDNSQLLIWNKNTVELWNMNSSLQLTLKQVLFLKYAYESNICKYCLIQHPLYNSLPGHIQKNLKNHISFICNTCQSRIRKETFTDIDFDCSLDEIIDAESLKQYLLFEKQYKEEVQKQDLRNIDFNFSLDEIIDAEQLVSFGLVAVPAVIALGMHFLNK